MPNVMRVVTMQRKVDDEYRGEVTPPETCTYMVSVLIGILV